MPSIPAVFTEPAWLILLVLLAPMAALARTEHRQRQRDWAALGQGGPPPPGRGIWWWLAALCLVLAVARPRWGRDPALAAPPGHDVAIAIDVSRSMAAEDAYPSRLALAQRLASQLVRNLALAPGERVGVVAFAGRGVVRCPLTDSPGAALDAIAGLRPDSVQPGGSDLGAGLASAVQVLLGPSESPEPAAGRAIVLFSDGEQPGRLSGPVPEGLTPPGIPVHCVSIGNPERGYEIPVFGAEGTIQPLRFRGSIVQSRCDPAPLVAISEATGGVFVGVGRAEVELDRLYRERIEPAERRERSRRPAADRTDRFPWFLGLALACLALAQWPGRLRVPSLARFLLLAMLTTAAGATGTDFTTGSLAAGVAAYRAGQLDEALGQFRAVAERHPSDPLPSYNLAATLYRLGQFEAAEVAYRRSRDHADGTLRLKIDFALGNTAVARGELSQALAHYDDCLAAQPRDRAGELVQRDARSNRRFVELADLQLPRESDPTGGSPRPRSAEPDRPGAEASRPRDPGGSGESPPGASAPATGATARSGGGGGSGANPAAVGTLDPGRLLGRALDRIERARENRSHARPADRSQTDQPDW